MWFELLVRFMRCSGRRRGWGSGTGKNKNIQQENGLCVLKHVQLVKDGKSLSPSRDWKSVCESFFSSRKLIQRRSSSSTIFSFLFASQFEAAARGWCFPPHSTPLSLLFGHRKINIRAEVFPFSGRSGKARLLLASWPGDGSTNPHSTVDVFVNLSPVFAFSLSSFNHMCVS